MQSTQSRQRLFSTLCLGGLLAALAAPAQAGGDMASGKASGKEAIKRGAYLVAFGGCADCHTPFKMGPNGPERDFARGLSGHPEGLSLSPPPQLDGPDWNWAGSASMTAFKGPWGVSYASNLTPDRETGIGAWTVKDFIGVMQGGKHPGSARPIMPPMPWQALAQLKERDLKAIYAYLMAQPAVKNKVAEYQPPVAAR